MASGVSLLADSQTSREPVPVRNPYWRVQPGRHSWWSAQCCVTTAATWPSLASTGRCGHTSDASNTASMSEWSRGSLGGLAGRLLLVLVLCWGGAGAQEDQEAAPLGQFVAGSFILTQKALSEAPYRYSRFLTVALEKMELTDPPTKRDEENCNVKYRIEPSGERKIRGQISLVSR